MKITRREFLQYSAATGVVISLGVFELKPIQAHAEANPPVWTMEALNICPYCGVGCGMVVGNNDFGQITYVEGDPDHPINEGALCSKGANAAQLNYIAGYAGPTADYKDTNSERVVQPLVRGPGDADWTVTNWDAALTDIAGMIKATRDANINSNMVCDNIAALGTAKDNNEECYLYVKLMRALGIVYLEHCARL